MTDHVADAIKLFTEYLKNKKPVKPVEHLIFIRDIPFIIPERNYTKYFTMQVLWLSPEIMEKAKKDLQVHSYIAKPRPRMYC